MEIAKKAFAKINLTLDVLNKRSDGYHNIISIMQTLDLCDEVTLEKQPSGVGGAWTHDAAFTNENTAYRAAVFMLEKYKIAKGVKIHIDKKIPVSAGLGGGSADAAAVIEGINDLFGLNLEMAELMAIGKEIGADVPFCILKGAAIAEGIGDRLTRIESRVNCRVVLARPYVEISTKDTYEKMDNIKLKHRPDTSSAIAALKAGDLKNLGRNMRNVLENVSADEYPEINKIKRKMELLGACGVLMSGTGPAVYGIFESFLLAENAYACLTNENDFETFATGFYYP